MFWIVAFLITGVITVVLSAGLLRSASATAEAENTEMALYARQLTTLEEEVQRGVISPEDAESTRVEISRRMLAADARAATSSRRPPMQPVIMIAATVLILTPAVYLQIGQPGFADLPLERRLDMADARRADRIDQATAEAAAMPLPVAQNPEDMAILNQLRTALRDRPDDLRGHELLVATEAQLGNFAEAHAAQSVVIRIKGDAVEASDLSNLTDLMVLAARGYVSPEAETAAQHALELDPKNGTARYYLGLMFAQTGRPDYAFNLWRDLLEEGPADAPWIPAIRAEIEAAAAAGGIRYELPDTPAPAIAADDQDMVRGMVDGLSSRLLANGGSAEEWARLIHSLGVLSEQDRAAEAFDRASAAFADDPAALSLIRDAGRSAGVIE